MYEYTEPEEFYIEGENFYLIRQKEVETKEDYNEIMGPPGEYGKYEEYEEYLRKNIMPSYVESPENVEFEILRTLSGDSIDNPDNFEDLYSNLYSDYRNTKYNLSYGT